MTNLPRVPADWEPQHAVWFAWPHNQATWPERFAPIPDFFRRLLRTVSETLPVRVLGNPSLRSGADIESQRIIWVDAPTNDCWIRDYGPLFVVGERPYGIDWEFNAWGGKYPPWDRDNAAGLTVLSSAGWKRREGKLCVEGGALEWDGQGRLLTTDCLVTESRNPGVSKEQVADRLHEIAGATEIVWVNGGGLRGDDTDGHIDQLARFIDPENVVAAVADPEDENHAGLEANFEILRRWGEQTSPRVRVHRLQIPPAREIDGQRVPESYCNYLRLGSERLLVPTFGDRRSDDRAISVLRELAQASVPTIEVLGIDCSDLIWGLGALHCASLNEPARV
ncbi:MAG: agmatine deiminase family protein [Planctomycetota bacterium]